MNRFKQLYTTLCYHNTTPFHLLALFIVTIWGITFVSTKSLLITGLSPSDILLYRFILAYVSICLCSKPFKLLANTTKDECLCLLTGLFGGTLYFITENTALEYTLVSNVALICSITPLLTMLIGHIVLKESRFSRFSLWGSIIAFTGVGIVIFNGRFVFNLNPIGDLLCLASALSWTLYTLITKLLSAKYSSLFIARKTFFYGMITLIPLLIYEDNFYLDIQMLSMPKVWLQLLFLGIIASSGCFILWNMCLRKLNTVILSNYIYLVPVVSITTSNLILKEEINMVIIIGTILVIAGMYFASKQTIS